MQCIESPFLYIIEVDNLHLLSNIARVHSIKMEARDRSSWRNTKHGQRYTEFNHLIILHADAFTCSEGVAMIQLYKSLTQTLTGVNDLHIIG